MRKASFITIVSLLFLAVLPSCLKSEVDEYEEWRKLNDAYTRAIDTLEYQKVVPVWAPMHSVYMKWHNNRALTAGNLVPISTSTVRVKYEMEDINGKKLGNSYKSNGDSIYESKVNSNIVGFWAGLTTMHVGDSVTMIIPYGSAYGSRTVASSMPYTNLIYHVKLVSIPAYEKPM